jgi:hypothetical protein
MRPIFADDRIDTVPILYWIGSVTDYHIRVLTGRMYVYMTIVEDCLENSCYLSIDLLHTIETTLTHSPRERRQLLNTDDTLVSDDEEIELVIDPREENKSEKEHPIYTQSSPEYSSPEYSNECCLHREYQERGDNEGEYISNLEYKYNPMSVEHHEYMLARSDLGCSVYGFGHVMCGGLK